LPLFVESILPITSGDHYRKQKGLFVLDEECRFVDSEWLSFRWDGLHICLRSLAEL